MDLDLQRRQTNRDKKAGAYESLEGSGHRAGGIGIHLSRQGGAGQQAVQQGYKTHGSSQRAIQYKRGWVG